MEKLGCMLETPQVSWWYSSVVGTWMTTGSDNPQVKRSISREVLSTPGSQLDLMTPQRLHADSLIQREGTFIREDDIVHASWRHEEQHEQGNRRGTCGWITSFLRMYPQLRTYQRPPSDRDRTSRIGRCFPVRDLTPPGLTHPAWFLFCLRIDFRPSHNIFFLYKSPNICSDRIRFFVVSMPCSCNGDSASQLFLTPCNF
jgi:hypothetical protein